MWGNAELKVNLQWSCLEGCGVGVLPVHKSVETSGMKVIDQIEGVMAKLLHIKLYFNKAYSANWLIIEQ